MSVSNRELSGGENPAVDSGAVVFKGRKYRILAEVLNSPRLQSVPLVVPFMK